MNFDDLLFVTSQDKSVTKAYLIQFIGEPEGLQTEKGPLLPPRPTFVQMYPTRPPQLTLHGIMNPDWNLVS
jgi:hypothetical protein